MESARTLLKNYKDLRGRKKKKDLILAVHSYMAELGYPVCFAENVFTAGYMTAGNPKSAEFLIAVPIFKSESSNMSLLTALLIAENLQENLRESVCFLFSYSIGAGIREYKKYDKEPGKSHLVIYLGEIAAGDLIEITLSKSIKRDSQKLDLIFGISGIYGNKKIMVSKKGRIPFRYQKLPYSVLIHSLAPKKDQKQSISDETNVNLLQAAILTMISRKAVK